MSRVCPHAVVVPVAMCVFVFAASGASATGLSVAPSDRVAAASKIGFIRFGADTTQTGVINLAFSGAGDAPVKFYERVGGRLKLLGTGQAAPGVPITLLKDATTWSCDRLVRRFTAKSTLADGTHLKLATSVRTVSCAHRFELRAPRRVAPGAVARVRVVDRWKIGAIRPSLCITPPQSTPACRRLVLPRAVAIAARAFRASTSGRWRVELQVRDHRVRAFVAVGAGTSTSHARVAPIVLATGDSTMQGIDSFLSDELGERATLVSDVTLGSRISRGNFWTKHAASQTSHHRQRVTVISVGAAYDAYPLTTAGAAIAECCDAPWIFAYADRVRRMMRSYLRGGHGRVFWLTPPLPRDHYRQRITTAIGFAVEHAAKGLTGVRVVRVDHLFSPDGSYTDVIRHRGSDVRVRDRDGIHLNTAGTAIVARLLAPAIQQALTEMNTPRAR